MSALGEGFERAVLAERARCVALLTQRAEWWESLASQHELSKRKHQANRCCLRADELRLVAMAIDKGAQ